MVRHLRLGVGARAALRPGAAHARRRREPHDHPERRRHAEGGCGHGRRPHLPPDAGRGVLRRARGHGEGPVLRRRRSRPHGLHPVRQLHDRLPLRGQEPAGHQLPLPGGAARRDRRAAHHRRHPPPGRADLGGRHRPHRQEGPDHDPHREPGRPGGRHPRNPAPAPRDARHRRASGDQSAARHGDPHQLRGAARRADREGPRPALQQRHRHHQQLPPRRGDPRRAC